MHPKQICTDIQSMGSKLVLEGEDLFIENPEKIYPEIEELVISYKVRIIQFLKGGYSQKVHSIKQTIDKIVDFYHEGCPVESKINSWLQHDEKSLSMLLILWRELYDNGWNFNEPIANYEDEHTDKLVNEVYERAMTHFKGAKA
ncbi:conserved hypothetical protein [Bacillus sp. 349Y]|nr:conserved hypothetical protein [Bacillus sp. 349Y]